ncbi:hypothetical protein AgCh_000443 [Apium graveolens]
MMIADKQKINRMQVNEIQALQFVQIFQQWLFLRIREDAEACLCHAIKIEAVKIGDLDVTDAINKALVACTKA